MAPEPLVRHEAGDPDAPPLVLLHGLTEAGTTWPDAVARWSSRWHVVAPDQRGHGRSPRFTDAQLGAMLDTFVDDTVTLLETLPAPAVVVGHSLGGRVAVAAALRRPDLLRGLLLEDPAVSDIQVVPPGFVDEQHRFLDTFEDGGGAAERVRMRQVTAWRDVEIDAWAACKPLVDRRMIDHLDLGDLATPACYDALTVPALVLYAVGQPLGIPADAVSNPLVRIEHVRGVGHCIRRDDPHGFHALADPWLEGLRPV